MLRAHDAIRQSPEQARRPAVRAQAVNRTNTLEGSVVGQIKSVARKGATHESVKTPFMMVA